MLKCAEIVIDKPDNDFYNSVEDFKRGYAEMLPNMRLGGKLTVREIIILRKKVLI